MFVARLGRRRLARDTFSGASAAQSPIPRGQVLTLVFNLIDHVQQILVRASKHVSTRLVPKVLLHRIARVEIPVGILIFCMVEAINHLLVAAVDSCLLCFCLGHLVESRRLRRHLLGRVSALVLRRVDWLGRVQSISNLLAHLEFFTQQLNVWLGKLRWVWWGHPLQRRILLALRRLVSLELLLCLLADSLLARKGLSKISGGPKFSLG